MIKRLSLVIFLVCIVINLVLVPACSSSAPAPTSAAPATSAAPKTTAPATTVAPSTEPIKIGVLLPFTGASAANFEGMKTALEYKMEEIGGKWMGRTVQLIIEDDGSNPTTATDKCRKFVESDKVDVVLGPLTGMDAPASYLTASKTPNIIYMALPETVLTFGGGNIFLPYGELKALGHFMGDYLATTMGYKTVTTLHDDFVAGEQFLTGLINTFEAKGGKSIQRQRTPMGATDYSANITGMQKADAVAFWLTPASAGRFMQQYFASGLKMPLAVPCCNVVYSSTLKNIGDQTLGMLGSQHYSRLIDSEENKKWVAGFQKKAGKMPESEWTAAYVSLTIFLEAVKVANGDTSKGAIADALRKVKVATPPGTFSFAQNGLGIGDLHIQQVVKTDTGYDWKNIKSYSQIPLTAPK